MTRFARSCAYLINTYFHRVDYFYSHEFLCGFWLMESSQPVCKAKSFSRGNSILLWTWGVIIIYLSFLNCEVRWFYWTQELLVPVEKFTVRMPMVRLELATPGLQTQCSSHWALQLESYCWEGAEFIQLVYCIIIYGESFWGSKFNPKISWTGQRRPQNITLVEPNKSQNFTKFGQNF